MLNSIFLQLPYQLKQLVFHLISYSTYRDRYKNNFNEHIKTFQKGYLTCRNNQNRNPIIIPTENISLLYGIKEPKSILDFEIIDKEKLKLKLRKKDYYNSIQFSNSLNTSGTSGSALKIPVSREFLQYKFASFYFFKSLHHSGFKSRTGSFVGRVFLSIKQNKRPYWIRSKFTNQIIFSQYHISSETVKEYLDAIKKFELTSIHGYPSTLTEFAKQIQNKRLVDSARSLQLNNITVGSETLSLNQKKILEEVFGCRVLNFYGQTESVVDIFECEKGNMHINEDFSFVELIPTENDQYRLVGTQLKNNLFPLIRYDTGDIVEYDPLLECQCGSHFRIIKNIIGRNEDYISLKDGRRIGRIDHIFKDSYNILQSQFVQSQYGTAHLYIVKGKNYDLKDEDIILKNIREKLGEDFIVELNYVEKLNKTSSGKTPQVINKMKDAH